MNREIARSAGPADDLSGHAIPVRHFSIRLAASRRGAHLARQSASERLVTWGWPYVSEANHTAALLVAELAANAALHGRERGRDFRLCLTLFPEDATLRIEVTDPRPDRRPPVSAVPPSVPSLDAESGRGLFLVAALADRWGTTCGDPYTKTVWCEVGLQQ
ncbi:ATP-binding protein [Streptomyces poonensis]|uniref:ATP-binding protein n=1 Tax=Streptomyces poonensis TaxID=68255 RepID=UPI001E384B01|nr:ATP-binding protein [Streptomyces poonensis]